MHAAPPRRSCAVAALAHLTAESSAVTSPANAAPEASHPAAANRRRSRGLLGEPLRAPLRRPPAHRRRVVLAQHTMSGKVAVDDQRAALLTPAGLPAAVYLAASAAARFAQHTMSGKAKQSSR